MKKIFSPLLTLAVAAGQLHAQSPALDQVDAAQQRRQVLAANAPAESYAGETDDVGVQSPLLTRPRRQLFEASGDVQYFYTDNMFNAADRRATDVLVGTLEAAFAPDSYALAGGQFAPRLGFRHEWYQYGLLHNDEIPVFDFTQKAFTTVPLSDFNFTAQTAFGDLAWTWRNWTFAAGYNFRRLISDKTDEEFYREHVPHWGVQRWIPINAHSGVTLAYEGDWRITKTAQPAIPTLHDDENDRADHSFLARYTHTVGRSGEISPYYRFQFTDFHGSIDRQDNLHTLGLVFAWHFCPRSTARVFVNYDLRDSSHAAIDSYQKLSTGLGFNLTFRF